MEIRRLRGGDERRLREIRLRALADAPEAFASTLERERAYGTEVWTAWVTSERAANFVAEDGSPVGIATGLLKSRPGLAHLAGMWVAPRSRGNGIARLLIETVAGWAREQGVNRLELWVADGNDAARALYAKAGFAHSGDRQPFPSNPAIMEDRLFLEL
jgi:GNAT superfamily N-acetyltransferase